MDFQIIFALEKEHVYKIDAPVNKTGTANCAVFPRKIGKNKFKLHNKSLLQLLQKAKKMIIKGIK